MSDFKRNLVESADAAARVGALFVAVAMFAAMWESDSPPEGTDEVWLARRANSSRAVVQIEKGSQEVSEQHSAHAKARTTLKDVSVTSVVTVPYPMPSGITPGNYRVVDTLGNIQTIQVTLEMVPRARAGNPLNQYIIEEGDRTIYFIRIRSGNTIAGAHGGAVRR